MGLDNGIDVKRNEYTESIPELKRFETDWGKKYKLDFPITYWRKCWGLRNDILFLIGKRWASEEEYEFSLTKDDVDDIIELLGTYNADNWEDSIWEWDGDDNYSEYVKQNIEDLKTLRALMDKYELEVYFYDSY